MLLPRLHLKAQSKLGLLGSEPKAPKTENWEISNVNKHDMNWGFGGFDLRSEQRGGEGGGIW
jgi:hypothetical protein